MQALRIESRGTTPQMDIKLVALNTFAFAAWMNFIAFKKGRPFYEGFFVVELLFGDLVFVFVRCWVVDLLFGHLIFLLQVAAI